MVNVRVSATNSAGTSGYGTTSLTIPLWAVPVLQNGWSNFGSPWATAGFTKTSSGLVVLKGLIKGGTATAGTLVATLPVGYRPADTLMFANSSNNAGGRIDVKPDGTISFSVGSNVYFSMDGISFMLSGTTFTAITPINGWSNYTASPYSDPLGYYQGSDSRVITKGIVTGGTTTDGTAIGALPASIAPGYYEHIVNLAGNTVYMSGVSSSPTSVSGTPSSIVAKTGTNAWDTEQAMFYPASYPSSSSCPAATTGWCSLTLQNSWVYYSPFEVPRYTKSSDGMVLLGGLIRSGTVTSGTVITTLPAGYCPKQQLLLTTAGNGAWANINILPGTGSGCTLVVGTANATWTTLGSLSFMAEW